MRDVYDDMEGKTIWRPDNEIRGPLDEVDIPDEAITAPNDDADQEPSRPVADENEPAITAPFESEFDDSKNVSHSHKPIRQTSPAPNDTPETADSLDENTTSEVSAKIARGVGAAATSNETTTQTEAEDHTQPEIPTMGDDTLDEIRELYRNGDMAASRPLQYRIAAQHKADREQVETWVGEWYEKNPTPGVNVDEVKRRFSDTWLKYALSKGKNTDAVLKDQTLAEETLAAYNANIAHVQTRNPRKAEGIALYNTKAEIDQAYAMADGHEYLTAGVVKRQAEYRMTNVVRGVKDLVGRVELALERCPDRKILDTPDALRLANANKDAGFIDRIDKYVADVRALSQQYAGHDHITPDRIRTMARDQANPAKAIEDRLVLADKLVAGFPGVRGLLRGEITEMCFNEADPTTTIQNYIQNMPAVVAAYPDIPFNAVRRLCLNNANPMSKAAALSRELQRTETEFAGTPRWIVNIAARSSDQPAAYLRERFVHIAPFKEQYAELLEGIPDSRMQEAVLRTDHPEENLRSIIADKILSDARDIRRAQPRGSRSVADLASERVIAKDVSEWTDDIPPGIDFDDATKRFSRIMTTATRGKLDWLEDKSLAKAVWSRYWSDTKALHESGFKRAAGLAEYTKASAILDHAPESDITPGIRAALADARLSDPIGRLQDYDRTLEQLDKQFGGQKYATKPLMQSIARGHPTDPIGAMDSYLTKVRDLSGEFSGVEGFDESVHNFFANNLHTDPANEVRKYLGRRQTIKDMFPDDSDLDDASMRELALHTANPDPVHLRHRVEDYKTRLDALTEMAHDQSALVMDAGIVQKLKDAGETEWVDKVTVGGPGKAPEIDTSILKYIAARNSTSTLTERLNQATRMQQRQEARKHRDINAPATREGKSLTVDQVIGDTSAIATTPEDLYIEQEEIQTRAQQRKLIDNLFAPEKLLLAYISGIAEEVDERRLEADLGTTDLRASADELLKKIRAAASRKLQQ